MFDKKSLLELVKSIGRFIYFGLLGVIAVVLLALVTSPTLIGLTIDILDVKVSIGGLVVLTIGLIAKAIDLYVRKAKNIDSDGIAPTFLQK